MGPRGKRMRKRPPGLVGRGSGGAAPAGDHHQHHAGTSAEAAGGLRAQEQGAVALKPVVTHQALGEKSTEGESSPALVTEAPPAPAAAAGLTAVPASSPAATTTAASSPDGDAVSASTTVDIEVDETWSSRLGRISTTDIWLFGAGTVALCIGILAGVVGVRKLLNLLPSKPAESDSIST